MIMQFGINMLVPIGLMSWLGILLDQKCGTSFFMILFFFIGAVAGFQNIWRMAGAVYRDKPQGESSGGKTEHHKPDPVQTGDGAGSVDDKQIKGNE